MKKSYKVIEENTLRSGNLTVSEVDIFDPVTYKMFHGDGKATCMHDDVYDYKLGRGISRDRATKKAVLRMVKHIDKLIGALKKKIDSLEDVKRRADHDLELIDARIARDSELAESIIEEDTTKED